MTDASKTPDADAAAAIPDIITDLLRLIFALPVFHPYNKQTGALSQDILPLMVATKDAPDMMREFMQHAQVVDNPKAMTAVLARLHKIERDGKMLLRIGSKWYVYPIGKIK